MTVETIDPHGFCRGVERAVRMAEDVLAAGPAYCFHPLVHNPCVCAALAAKGLREAASPDEVPPGSTVVFSAHGVAPSVRRAVAARGCRAIDATCPFVERMHRDARDFALRGVPVAIIGRAEHAETRGVAGEAEKCGGTVRILRDAEGADALDLPADRPVGVLCQTTFDAREAGVLLARLAARYPLLETPAAASVCTATRDRQNAVIRFVESGGDGVLVLGDASSSNTMRLVELATAAGARFAARAGSAEEAGNMDFSGVSRLGVTSGASTPEETFAAVFNALSAQRTIAR